MLEDNSEKEQKAKDKKEPRFSYNPITYFCAYYSGSVTNRIRPGSKIEMTCPYKECDTCQYNIRDTPENLFVFSRYNGLQDYNAMNRLIKLTRLIDGCFTTELVDKIKNENLALNDLESILGKMQKKNHNQPKEKALA